MVGCVFCPKIGHHSLKKFTNGWLRFFVPKNGHHSLKKFTNGCCVFCPKKWAPLVKKIHKWLAAFFCPKKWAPLVKKIHKWLAAFFCPKKWAPLVKKFTNGCLRFFVPFSSLNQKKTLITFKKVFASEVTNFHLFQHFGFSLKKIHKWLAAFFCPKIGHHLLKKNFSHFFLPRKKSLFTPELENYQTKIFNSV